MLIIFIEREVQLNMSNDLAMYYFHQGTNFNAYSYLGCNRIECDNGYSYSFRVWAPNAKGVGLISDFTGWDNPLPMNKISDGGIWELIYSSDISIEGAVYKYRITSSSGTVNKGDPYAKCSKGSDDGASIVYTESHHTWSDGNWLRHRRATVKERDGIYLSCPINIYEVHLGSFKRHPDGSYLTYRELAGELVSYVKAMGYTHIELMPIAEYPYDGSWGYQVGAFFAPTTRFGSPDDFKYFINRMHKAGIGVIIDWVPAHFPKDEWGLFEFDGQPLYEYQGVDRQESRSWGTRFFDVGREEVQSFLISSALYFLRELHIDGLRVDAVASMLYLDYDRDAGEWIPNNDGTNTNLESVAFLRKLNTAVFKEFPDILMIAEESTAIGNITKPVSEGGIGFNLKWNMGWANDFYDYLALDPINRKFHHKALNFPIMYAFTENYCLPISHDEVVHGKKSFIDKIFGSYEDKLSTMRAALLLMMTFPGKKLLFMGTEYGQFREWDYENSLEWFMLSYPTHSEMREYVRALNNFYLSHPELYDRDFVSSGFKWILADESDKNTVAYRRISNSGSSVITVINFSGTAQDIKLRLKDSTSVDILFTTQYDNGDGVLAVSRDEDGCYVNLTVPRLSGMILKEKIGRKNIKIKGVDDVL